jgi:membrane fusion protein (multidrug efflux system)
MDNAEARSSGIEFQPDSTTRRAGVGPGSPPQRRRNAPWRILLALIVGVIAVGAVLLYRSYSQWESTDDAQIDGYIYPVNSRITGYVARVTVDDHQYVKAGTVLVQLDPKDYEVAVANANAVLSNDRANEAALATNISLTVVNTGSQLSSAEAEVENGDAAIVAAERSWEAARAALRQAEANDLKAQDDVNRYRPLAEKDEIPQQHYTQAIQLAKATGAGVDAAGSSAAAAEQAVVQARARLEQTRAQLRYAQTAPQQVSVQRSRVQAAAAEKQRAAALLEQAALNLQ